MVDIAPFHALRFAGNKKSLDISKFICPPYDVISEKERSDLVKGSPHNVVQLELPEGPGDEKYFHAARLLQQWKGMDVLVEDLEKSFYLLETTYAIKDVFAPQKNLKRFGVMVALRLETPGKGAIHPHEKTLPKAKEDRMKLISAVQTNISPVFGLFFDHKKEWKKLISAVVSQKPLASGREKKDLNHRVWKIDERPLQEKFRKLLKSKDLYIADGH